MGKLVVPPNFGVLAYKWSLSGDPEAMFSTVGVDTQNFANPGNFQAQVDAFADQWIAALGAGATTSPAVFQGCVLRTANGGVFEAPRNVVGTAGAVALPNNCAYLLKKKTNTAGRRGRGRMYIPPVYIGEGSISGLGVLDAASRTSLENSIRAAMPIGPFVLLHSQEPLGPAPPPPFPIVSFDLDVRIATQRRRLRR